MKYKDLHEAAKYLVDYLLMISLPAQRQVEIHGLGEPSIEMQEYLWNYEGEVKDIDVIKEQSLIFSKIIKGIKDFLDLLTAKDDDFWHSFKTSLEWNEIKQEAREIINDMALSKLELITTIRREETNGGVYEAVDLYVIIEKTRTHQELKEAIDRHLDWKKSRRENR